MLCLLNVNSKYQCPKQQTKNGDLEQGWGNVPMAALLKTGLLKSSTPFIFAGIQLRLKYSSVTQNGKHIGLLAKAALSIGALLGATGG